MKIETILSIVLLLAAVPAFAQKVYIDYHPGYDRSGIRTFAWYKTEETSLAKNNPLMHSRLINEMEYYLGRGGLYEVEQDPDIYVTYHTNAESQFQLDVVSWGYSYPDDFYWGGYWGTDGTMVQAYNQGSLVIDIWDRRTKELIWRGSAHAVVPPNPRKAELKAYKALEKMAKKWNKMKTQEARGN